MNCAGLTFAVCDLRRVGRELCEARRRKHFASGGIPFPSHGMCRASIAMNVAAINQLGIPFHPLRLGWPARAGSGNAQAPPGPAR